MMIPEIRSDGAIVAPRPAYGPNGERGDGMYLYRPGDPGYDEWREFVEFAALFVD